MGTTSYPNLESFEIVQTGTTSITIPAVLTPGEGSENVYVAHNLGYSPVIIAYVYDSGGYYPLPYTPSYASSATGITPSGVIVCSANSTNVVISTIHGLSGTTPSLSGTWTIKYYLLRERAS